TTASLVETVPTGWIPSSPSNGGQVNGETITWNLTSPFPSSVTYKLKAVGNAVEAPIGGLFSDPGALGKYSVGGAGLLFSPTDMTDLGYIKKWLLLGPYTQPAGLSASPGLVNMRKDHLTDEGAIKELTVQPSAGDVVNTHYGPPTCTPGGPPCTAPPKARS